MRPFSYLDGTLQVLIVEDDQTSAFLVHDILAFAPVYNVKLVSACSAAADMLQSAPRTHVLVLDLGIRDVENDEFYLLRQFASKTSVIVFTGSDSPQKGAQSVLLGAKAVVEKGASLDSFEFFRTVNRSSMINLINSAYSEVGGSTTLWTATKVLLEKRPGSVNEWAGIMGITDRQLRNVWSSGNLPGARNALFLFQLFSKVFSYYESAFNGEASKLELLQDLEYQRFAEYYLTHKQLFSSVIQ